MFYLLKINIYLKKFFNSIRNNGFLETIKKCYSFFFKKNTNIFYNIITFDYKFSQKILKSIYHENPYLVSNHEKIFFELKDYKLLNLDKKNLIISLKNQLKVSIYIKSKNFNTLIIQILNNEKDIEKNKDITNYIDFYLVKKSLEDKFIIDKGHFFFDDDKSLFILISKIFQIFLKKKYVMIPIVKKKLNFNTLSKLQNFKNVYFNLKKNSNINLFNTFKDIISSINIYDVDYFYVSEDLFWLHNDLTQQDKKIDNSVLKKLLSRILFSGSVIKKI
jgi:hypothetical protein